MQDHHEHSAQGRGNRCWHRLDRVIIIGVSFVALDSGDADEFSFGKAGGSACFRGLCPCEQGKVAVAS